MEFVTYEIGKKLKEKGYPHGYNCFGRRPIYSDECTIKCIQYIGAYERGYYGENIPCPTINEVLKWLREEKDIYVQIEYINNEYFGSVIIRRTTGGVIASYKQDKFHYSDSKTLSHEKYEQAALAGIEYALDNLI